LAGIFSYVYHCALKIPKFFKYFFTGEDPPFYTAFYEASGKGGGLYVKHGSRFGAGPGDGCAEEWLGLRDLPKLGWRMLAVSRAKGFYTQGYPHLPMTEIVFQESM
jgi:hypothetical protein